MGAWRLFAMLFPAAALVCLGIVQFVRGRRRLRAHQAACMRPGYNPEETFTGTVRHLSGLPVGPGRKLGAACNRGWGMVFASGRFRYAVPREEIAAIEIRPWGRRHGPGGLWYLLILHRQGGSRIELTLPWPARFAGKLAQTFAVRGECFQPGFEPGQAGTK